MPKPDDVAYSEWPEGDGLIRLSNGPVELRLHLDHLENESGDIWAVAWNDNQRYFTAHAVEVLAPLRAAQREAEQPRAFLEGTAVVWGITDGAHRELYLL